MTLAAILGFGAGTVIFAAGLLAWMAHRQATPPPLEVRVDRTLAADGGWTLRSKHFVGGFDPEASVEVEARKLGERDLHLHVRRRWTEYGSDLELGVTFVPDAAPEVSVKGKSYYRASGQAWHDG